MSFFKQFWKEFKEAASRIQQPSTGEPQWSLTPRAQAIFVLAQKQAVQLKHGYIGTEHLLLGLLELGQGAAFNVMTRSGLDPDKVRTETEKAMDRPGDSPFTPQPTPRLKRVFDLANEERKALNHRYLGTEHLLLGILKDGDGVAARVLRQLGLNLDEIRQEVLKELDPHFLPGEER
jgi:ATP-dependent Clp protease ATP-binding subunit ClpC